MAQKPPIGTVIQTEGGSYSIFNGKDFVPARQNGNSWAVDQDAMDRMGIGKAPAPVDQNAFNDAANQLKDVRGARESVTGFWEAPIKGIPLPATIMSNTGLVGALTRGIPGSPGYNLDRDLGTIRSRLLLQNLSRLKRQSPTGSTGLGPLSNAEGETLKTTVAALDTGLPAGQLRQNLDRVREQTLLDQPGLTPDTAYDLSGGQSRNTIPRGAYYRDKSGNIRINKNGDGGNPIYRAAQPTQGASQASQAPAGVDPVAWAHMTPQERALWN